MGYLLRDDLEDIDRAIACLTRRLSIDPSYALAYAGLGHAYASEYALTKNPAFVAEATRNAGRAVELNDRLIPVRMSLAMVYQQTGQLDKALAEFRQVLEQDPTVTIAEYSEAEVYQAQGNYRQAEDLFKHAVSRYPSYARGYTELGTLYYSIGRFSDAVQQFQSVIDLAPDHPEGYIGLGGSYIALGRYDDAIAVLKKGLSIKPSAYAWSNQVQHICTSGGGGSCRRHEARCRAQSL